MDSTDRIVLVAGPGPEVLAAVLLLTIGIAGSLVSVVLLRRGRKEAWPLGALLMLLSLFAVVALWHMPTRFAVGKEGVDLSFWGVNGHRDWNEIEALGVTRIKFGLWLVVSQRSIKGAWPISFWAPRMGYLVRGAPVDAGELATKVTAWRISAQH